MVQNTVKKLCGVSEKVTGDLATDQLAAATKHIDALAHPLKPNDIRALLPLLPRDGDTAAGLKWSLLHAIAAAPDWPMWDLLGDQSNEWVHIFRLRLANGGPSSGLKRFSVGMSRYDLTDFEWRVIAPPLLNTPRGVPRVDDRRLLVPLPRMRHAAENSHALALICHQ